MRFGPGAHIGPFEILAQVGAGGMGEVYRARDIRLDRIVALKFLASDALTAERVERFKREARAVSRLTHPNICALYDIGEQNGSTFLVMEYIHGRRSPTAWSAAGSDSMRSFESAFRSRMHWMLHIGKALCIATSSLETSSSRVMA